MKIQHEAERNLTDGLQAIAEQFKIPSEFPFEVIAAAQKSVEKWNEKSHTQKLHGRLDAMDLPLVTLDPATSIDLDQAFALRKQGDQIILSYALADVGQFVPFNGAVETEAWNRGVTIYSMPSKVSLYPKSISQDAASLLPNGSRPAILVEVSIASDGTVHLVDVQRAVCQSRAKLAYDSIDLNSIPLLEEFAQRMWHNENQRGSVRLEFPQQEIVEDENSPGGIRLSLRALLYSERVNAALSLAVNMALAQMMQTAGIGLYRVMDEPEPRAIRRLRFEADAIGIVWAEEESLNDLKRRLNTNDPLHQRFLLTVRRAGGHAGYENFILGKIPWHSALAATYVHATAPMRRLADRYVLELAICLVSQQTVAPELIDRLEKMPVVMAEGEGRASRVDKAVIDLVEAVSLQDRIGEVLTAEVVDAEAGIVQTIDSAIRSRVAKLGPSKNGEMVRVRIDHADPIKRKIVLTAV